MMVLAIRNCILPNIQLDNRLPPFCLMWLWCDCVSCVILLLNMSYWTITQTWQQGTLSIPQTFHFHFDIRLYWLAWSGVSLITVAGVFSSRRRGGGTLLRSPQSRWVCEWDKTNKTHPLDKKKTGFPFAARLDVNPRHQTFSERGSNLSSSSILWSVICGAKPFPSPDGHRPCAATGNDLYL